MNERSFTGTGGGGGGDINFQMYRRAPGGEIVLEEVAFDSYCHPPKGKQGRFRLNGWAPYYQSEGQYGVKTRTRAEYLIVKMPSNKELEGRLFAQQFPIPKHIDNENSTLGQFLAALLNRPIAVGETINLDDFTGTEFVTTVTRDENGDRIYCGVSWDSIDPDKTVLSPYLNGAGPQREPALVGTGGEDGNPFEGAEEDL